MTSGGGGYNGIGPAGGVEGVQGVAGGQSVKDNSGLNPNRIRGFGPQRGQGRFESPTLNQMRAQQGAIVSNFDILQEKIHISDRNV